MLVLAMLISASLQAGQRSLPLASASNGAVAAAAAVSFLSPAAIVYLSFRSTRGKEMQRHTAS
jgi:hypothetical protein